MMRHALPMFLVMIAAAAIMSPRYAYANAEVGQPAPALIAKELDGNTFDLSAERGKVTIVNFWATWCGPCRKEIPALEAVFRRYHDKGLEMIAVSADRRHDRSSVVEMAQSFGYPAAMMNEAQRNGFGSPTELPETFVIDRNGIVRDRFTPDNAPLTEQSLSDAIAPLLEQQPASSAPAAQ